jgi:hypothetical protein
MALFNRFRPGRAKLPSARDDDQELDEIARMRAGPRSPGLGQTGSAPINQANQAADAERVRGKVDAAVDRRAGEVRDAKNKDKDGDGYDDDLGDIARMRAQQEQERKAREAELAASKAQALGQVDARAGLGGFGLSGASAALRSDVGRTQDRSATLAMGELGKKQRDEEWQFRQREAAVDMLERDSDKDVDGDGLINGAPIGEAGIGDGDPDNDMPTGRKPRDDDKERPVDEGALKRYKDAHKMFYGARSALEDSYIGSDAAYNYYQDVEGNIARIPKGEDS